MVQETHEVCPLRRIVTSDDSQLLAQVGRGDRQALAQIYHRHKDVLLTATAYLLRGDRGAAEDVLHDVVVTLAANASAIHLRGSLKNYLLTACLNRARDLLRRRRDQTIDPNHLSELAGFAVEVDAWADSERHLADALALLPDEQREVVTLHIHGGQTFREIAEALEISINTVQSRYRYALAALREELATRNSTSDDGRNRP